MRYLVKFSFPVDVGNAQVDDPEFGNKMQEMLKDVQAEAAYFTAVEGQRGGYIVTNLEGAHEIPKVAEPLFQWLKADIEFIPVMLPEDLAKAGPDIGAAAKKWG